ncbi:MAG TPA: RNA polymerase sigma factor, partial [Bacteroidota bacterium]|nr:RNA polymerase sigma factor [Bacteroidota bacterium]
MEEKVPDMWLLEQVKHSDTEAFRILFERYQPMLFRRMMYQTGEKDLAHDLVQETFIRVWEHRAILRPQLSFAAYLLRISGNLAKDAFRYRSIRQQRANEVPMLQISEGDNPDE